MHSVISGFGSFLPSKCVNNVDLPSHLNTSNEWIVQRTGIKQRFIVSSDEKTSDLAMNACKNALVDANISPSDIDAIIVGTVTPDLTFPSVATIIQKELGIPNAFAFDLSAACSGFLYAMDVADSYIKLGKIKRALVVGADTFSKIVDWNDRSSCVLFGDGAGAVVLESSDLSDKGIQDTILFSNGCIDELKTNGGVSSTQNSGFVQMNGKEVFRSAIEVMKNAVSEIMHRNNLTQSDVDFLIPHQANLRIISALAESLNFAMEKVIVSVDEHANTSAASIPLAMASHKQKIIGKNVILVSMGAGFTWGASYIKM